MKMNEERSGGKTMAMLYILNILKKRTDYDHPMTQAQLAEALEQEYEMVVERKKIANDISRLQEAGYEIERNANGLYYNGYEFEQTELKLIIDSILSNRSLNVTQSKDLVERIIGLSSQYFKPRSRNLLKVYGLNKTNNPTVAYTMELAEKAMGTNCQLRVDAYRYDSNMNLEKRKTLCISPVQMLMKDQYYYLLGVVEARGRVNGQTVKKPALEAFRMDLLSNAELTELKSIPLCQVEGYEHGIDCDELLRAYPYLMKLNNKPELCIFHCMPGALHRFESTFGTDISVREVDAPMVNGKPACITKKQLEVRVMAEPYNAMHFASCYATELWLTAPRDYSRGVSARLMLQLGMSKRMLEACG